MRKGMWGFFASPELLIGDMFLTLALVLQQAVQHHFQSWSKLYRLPACWQHYKYSHKEGGEHLENCQAIITWIKVPLILGPNYSSHNKLSLWIHYMNSSFQSKLHENEMVIFFLFMQKHLDCHEPSLPLSYVGWCEVVENNFRPKVCVIILKGIDKTSVRLWAKSNLWDKAESYHFSCQHLSLLFFHLNSQSSHHPTHKYSHACEQFCTGTTLIIQAASLSTTAKG